jgi:Tol biopolymer transport system component
MIGANKGPEFDKVDDILFSPDGSKVVYRAKLGTKEFIMVGDKKGPEFDRVDLGLAFHRLQPFSPDGLKLIYSAIEGDKWFAVIDGQKGPEYLAIMDPVFAPDGTAMYAAMEGDLNDKGKWFIVVGRERVTAVQAPFVFRPTVSQDIKRLAYVAVDDKGYLLVTHDGPDVRYDAIGDLVFSPSGHVLAYRAKRGKKEFIVVEGKEGPEFEAGEGRDFEAIDDPVFSPDGRKIAYAARQGHSKRSVVIRDDMESNFRKSSFDSVSSIVFSTDGARLAFAAKDESGSFIVVGDDRGETFDLVGAPVFNPDGTRVAFGARRGKQLWWKVMRLAVTGN